MSFRPEKPFINWRMDGWVDIEIGFIRLTWRSRPKNVTSKLNSRCTHLSLHLTPSNFRCQESLPDISNNSYSYKSPMCNVKVLQAEVWKVSESTMSYVRSLQLVTVQLAELPPPRYLLSLSLGPQPPVRETQDHKSIDNWRRWQKFNVKNHPISQSPASINSLLTTLIIN